MAPPPTPLADSTSDPAPADLRSLLTPKKQDLRDTIRNKTPSAPSKVKMVLVTPNPNYTGPGARAGTDQMDIRERSKTEEERRKEKEAEDILAEQRAVRKAAEEEEAREAEREIAKLTRYKDALLSNSCQP